MLHLRVALCIDMPSMLSVHVALHVVSCCDMFSRSQCVTSVLAISFRVSTLLQCLRTCSASVLLQRLEKLHHDGITAYSIAMDMNCAVSHWIL